AAVYFYDRLDDGQAEPGAGKMGRRTAAEEAFEELILFALRDAAAGVGDFDEHKVVTYVDGDADIAADGCELERVRDQVVQRLTDALAVGAHVRLSRCVEIESHPFRLG